MPKIDDLTEFLVVDQADPTASGLNNEFCDGAALAVSIMEALNAMKRERRGLLAVVVDTNYLLAEGTYTPQSIAWLIRTINKHVPVIVHAYGTDGVVEELKGKTGLVEGIDYKKFFRKGVEKAFHDYLRDTFYERLPTRDLGFVDITCSEADK